MSFSPDEILKYGFRWLTKMFLVFGLIILSTMLGVCRVRGASLESNVSQIYYYEMSKEQQRTLLKKIRTIEKGCSVQNIINILGKPTYDQKLVSKPGVLKARILKYYTKILKKDLVNERHDRYVRFILNIDNNLIDVESNVEGIEIHPSFMKSNQQTH